MDSAAKTPGARWNSMHRLQVLGKKVFPDGSALTGGLHRGRTCGNASSRPACNPDPRFLRVAAAVAAQRRATQTELGEVNPRLLL